MLMKISILLCVYTCSEHFLLQVFAIEFIAFVIDFVPFAVDFVAFAVIFVPFAIEFIGFAVGFIAIALEFITFAQEFIPTRLAAAVNVKTRCTCSKCSMILLKYNFIRRKFFCYGFFSKICNCASPLAMGAVTGKLANLTAS